MGERSCLVCQTRTESPGVRLGSYRAYRCASCGFRWVDREDLDRWGSATSFQDYPHNAFLRAHFDAMKPLYRRGLQERVARAWPGRDLKQCAFLDVGCANGEYLWAAKSLGFGGVAGVEVDEMAAQRARAFGPVSADAEELPESSFDIVQLKNVVANLRDFHALLARCAALAKPGGLVFVDAPNEDSLAARLRRRTPASRAEGSSYGYLRPPHVINGFGRESITRLIAQYGLTTTLFRTVWIGHPLAPYRPSGLSPMSLLGRLLPNAGALLIVDSRRAEGADSGASDTSQRAAGEE